jgi:hypothetical protein
VSICDQEQSKERTAKFVGHFDDSCRPCAFEVGGETRETGTNEKHRVSVVGELMSLVSDAETLA